MIKVRILFFCSIALTILFAVCNYAIYALPLLLGIMLIRNFRFTIKWLLCVLPGAVIFGIVSWFSAPSQNAAFYTLIAAAKMLAISSGFLLFFGFFPNKRLKYLLHDSGLPFMAVFIISSAVNISHRIRNIYIEVRDAQRLRGIDVTPSIKNIPKYAALFVPIFIRSLKMADLLGISIYQRGIGRPFNDRRFNGIRNPHNTEEYQSEGHILPGHNKIPHLQKNQDSRQSQ